MDSEEKMLAELESAGIVGAKIWCGEPDQTERAFAEAAKTKLDLLIVLGVTAPYAQLHKYAPKLGRILCRSREER